MGDTPREKKIRRVLEKQGYRLEKSRGGESIDDRGGYRIVDAQRNAIEAGERFDLSLEEVETFAAGEDGK